MFADLGLLLYYDFCNLKQMEHGIQSLELTLEDNGNTHGFSLF